MITFITLALGLAAAGAAECAGVAGNLSSVRVAYDSRVSAVGHMSDLIFTPASDGALKAFDADSGRDLWTFVAPDLRTSTANTDLMTDIAVLRFDANGDGVIDAAGGDRVWLYFGLERAGPYYYALDVSRRTPDVLWNADATTLPGLADAWSTPTIARVRIAGATQNGEHFVVIVGGGFSPDSSAAGSHLFMLDAATGRPLWSSGSDSSSDLRLSHMTHGIAARVATLDIDGDGFADRLYTADVGGRIWRFDVWNGHSRDRLVTGGVFASLGIADLPPESAASSDARRFFVAPDVALMQPPRQDPWYNLSIGSGDGDDLRAAGVRNRFYSLRDRDPFRMRSQTEYDSASPLMDDEVPNLADGAANAIGWKLDLAAGEAVFAESLTASGVVMFTTHQAGASSDGSLCASDDRDRVYAVHVETGAAALDLNHDAQITDADRSADLQQTGIPPGVRIELPGQGGSQEPPATPGEPPPGTAGAPPSANAPRCRVGAELLSRCVPLDAVVRTFWKSRSVN